MAKTRLRRPQVKRTAAAAFDPVVLLCQAHGLPIPDLEFPFAESAGRKYRADYCWRSGQGFYFSPAGSVPLRLVLAGVILEVQGGIWSKGGKPCPVCHQSPRGAHNTGTALLRDFDKLNLAQTLGYVVIQATPEQVKTGDVLKWLKQLL